MKIIEEKTNDARREQLNGMGFPSWIIDQALEKTKDVEEAINWITRQMDSKSKSVTEEVDNKNLEQLVSMVNVSTTLQYLFIA